MLVQDLLSFLTQIFFSLLGLLSFSDYLRQPEPIKRDIALAFGSIAVNTSISLLRNIIHLDPFISTLGTLALLAQPYLFLRLSRYLQAVPKLLLRVALVGMFFVWILRLIPTNGANISPLSAITALGMIIYFVSINGYVAFRFLKGVRNSSGLLRQRLKLCMIGTALLALALLLILPLVFQAASQDFLLIPVHLIVIFSAISFFLGFVPPRWLQRIWQTTEFRNFLVHIRRESASAWLKPEDFLEELALAASNMTGGTNSLILGRIAEKRWQVLYMSPSSGLRNHLAEFQPVFVDAWEKKSSLYETRNSTISNAERSFLEINQAAAMLIVPVPAVDYLLLVCFAQPLLFPEDDRELLKLLAEQAGVILENIAVVEELETRVRNRTLDLEESEERFRSIFEQAAVGIAEVSLEGKFIRINQRFCEMLGYTKTEMQTLSFQEITHPDDLEADLNNVRALVSGVIPNYSMQKRYYHKARQIVWINLTVSLVRDSSGNPKYFISIIEDISQQKWGEVARYKAEMRFARVLDTTAEAVIAVDAQQNILLFNQSAERMFGYSQAEILGKNLECLLPDELVKHHSAYVKRFAEGQDIARGMGERHKELAGKRKDGGIFPIEASVSKLTEDEEVLLTVFMRDISEQVWITKALRESEGRYERIVENMLEGFQIIGFNWQYLYINEAAARHGKKAKEELLGHTLMEKYPGIEATEMFALLQTCMEERIRRHAEFEFVYADGTSAWFEQSIQPVPEGLFILSLEITERKKAEESLNQLNEELELRVNQRTEELRQSEEKFAKAFWASPAAISIATMPDGRWIEMNEALANMTGYSKEELLGHSSAELGLVDLSARAKILEAIQKQGKVRNVEIQLQTKTGKSVDVLLSVEEIQLNGQDCALTIQYDISEQKRAEREIRRLNQDLEERTGHLELLNKELEAFSYSVSHDLRAPLRALDGFSQALLEDYNDDLDEDGQEYLGLIRFESQRMGRLIDDLISLARLSRHNLQREKVDLTAMAEEIAATLRQREPQRQVHFSIQSNLFACADSRLLHIALENLMGNAWKYSGKTAEAAIEVGCQEKDGKSQFFVRDNGVGFDMAYVHKLFGAFQRLHGMTEFEGTGIGLATVQRIIHRHGGFIKAEGVVNQGACFYFTLGEISC